MTRLQLEHIIRAASTISEDREIVVVGSQAILGQFPNAPPELLVSNEADIYPRTLVERWNLIDGTIGELSAFHDTFGYYAQGVQPGTAFLPRGWEDRVIVVANENTLGARGLCLEAHDLAASKLYAGREKDLRFVDGMVRAHMLEQPLLRERLETLDGIDLKKQALALQRLSAFTWGT